MTDKQYKRVSTALTYWKSLTRAYRVKVIRNNCLSLAGCNVYKCVMFGTSVSNDIIEWCN